MTRYRVKWKGAGALRKEINRLAHEMPDTLMESVEIEGWEIIKESMTLLPGPVSGRLADSHFVEITKKGRLTVGYTAPHATYLHEGYAGGFMPPSGGFLGGYMAAKAKGEKGQVPLKFLEIPIKRRLPTMARRIARRARGL